MTWEGGVKEQARELKVEEEGKISSGYKKVMGNQGRRTKKTPQGLDTVKTEGRG